MAERSDSAAVGPRLRIGISSCLLGEQVRFDGGHKRDRFLTDTFGRWCDWVAVCPELELGLGVPRESLRLVGSPDAPRLIAPRSGADHTAAMRRWAESRVAGLRKLDLHGFVLKKDSPSCGMERCRVYHERGGGAVRRGTGIFARVLMDRLDLLPVEEEGRLHDPRLRENFVERVFAHYRWKDHFSAHPRPGDLVRFHTAHKLSILSHSRTHYGRLGRLVAEAGRRPMRVLLAEYGALFMQALRLLATPKKHANVLQHLQGHLKRELDREDTAELAACIDDYRRGLVPLVVPVTLLRHHFRRHPDAWVDSQTYLDPYPAELMLRNHV